MLRYLLSFILISLATVAFTQDNLPDTAEVRSSTIEFNGGKYSGYQAELNASPDIVEDAVKERFKLQGLKARETKGFMVYRNVVIPSVDPSKPVDAFIKVEKKSKKEKDQSVVYFIAARPGEIPEDKLKSDAAARSAGISTIERSSSFLTALLPDVRQEVFDKNVSDQQSLLKKEQKKLDDLADDQKDLEKKLKKLQSDLEYNKNAQERQATEVEKAKATLADLLAKNPKGIQ